MFNSSHERCHRLVRGLRQLLKLGNSQCDRCVSERQRREASARTRTPNSVVDQHAEVLAAAKKTIEDANLYGRAALQFLPSTRGTNRDFFQYATFSPSDTRAAWKEFAKQAEQLENQKQIGKAGNEIIRDAIKAAHDLPDAS